MGQVDLGSILGLIIRQLCEFGKICNLSEPQVPKNGWVTDLMTSKIFFSYQI